jgi:hypothetical protein
MMEIKFTAYTWEELQLAAEFMKRLADLQQHRREAEDILKEEYAKRGANNLVQDEVPQTAEAVYAKQINRATENGQARPGAVLGGMPAFGPGPEC